MMEEFILKLQKQLQLENPLASEGAGVYSLHFDTTKIIIKEYPPGFQFKATIASLPEKELEPIFVNLLNGNLFHKATKGANLGLDQSETHVTLTFTYTLPPTYRDFIENFEDFLNTIDFWKEEVAHPV